jgi:hypothetical protein
MGVAGWPELVLSQMWRDADKAGAGSLTLEQFVRFTEEPSIAPYLEKSKFFSTLVGS